MDDIYSPKVYTDGVPYEAYARLRAEQPVSWQEEPELPGLPGGPGFWAVMRYDDVQHVSRTADVYSAALGGTQLRDPDPEDLEFVRSMLLNMDPPHHNALRRIISPLFTPRRVATMAAAVHATAAGLVDRAREMGSFDLVEDVTDVLALTTLTEILGVPTSDRPLFFSWANRIIGYQDEEYAHGTADGVDPRSTAALSDMHEYAASLADHRRRHPGDDVLSALVHGDVDGRPLTNAEFRNFFFLFAVAGNDTTRSALPGGLLALMDHPDQAAAVRADPELLAPAVEECLRYAPPVVLFRRTATRDVELRGARIAAGDKVVVFYPAANRDPGAFADPDEFRITRTPNRHVSFGFGPHTCVAAALARLQLGSMFEAVLRDLPGLRRTGPVERLESHLVAGIKRVPVAVGAH